MRCEYTVNGCTLLYNRAPRHLLAASIALSFVPACDEAKLVVTICRSCRCFDACLFALPVLCPEPVGLDESLERLACGPDDATDQSVRLSSCRDVSYFTSNAPCHFVEELQRNHCIISLSTFPRRATILLWHVIIDPSSPSPSVGVVINNSVNMVTCTSQGTRLAATDPEPRVCPLERCCGFGCVVDTT